MDHRARSRAVHLYVLRSVHRVRCSRYCRAVIGGWVFLPFVIAQKSSFSEKIHLRRGVICSTAGSSESVCEASRRGASRQVVARRKRREDGEFLVFECLGQPSRGLSQSTNDRKPHQQIENSIPTNRIRVSTFLF